MRWSQHKSKSKTENSYFYNTIRKYGTQNFTFEIIKECETEELAYEYERVLIKLFNLQDKKYGYNIIEGGSGGCKGYKVSDHLKSYFKEKYVGSNSVKAKFSDDEIINILSEYSSGNFTTYDLAEKYQCGKSTMIRIINGTSYANVQYDRSEFIDIGIKNKQKEMPSGSDVKTSKLSEQDVIQIREYYGTGRHSYQELADMFGVTKTNIYNIIKYRTWKI